MTSISATPASPSFVVVSNIRAQGVSSKARYYVRVLLGSQQLKTEKAKPHDSKVEWASSLTLTISGNGQPEIPQTLLFQLYSKDTKFHFSRQAGVVSLGQSTLSLKDLIGQDGSHRLTLGDVVVFCNVQAIGLEKLLDDASQSTKALNQLPSSISRELPLGEALLGGLQTSFDIAEPLLEKFESVMTLMGKLAEVHPYAQVAWAVLSVIPKLYLQEIEQNKQLVALLDSLKEINELVLKDEALQDLASQNPGIQLTMSNLANHTRNCVYFVQSYASKSHRSRLVETVFTDPKDTIADLEGTSTEIRGKLTALLTQSSAVDARIAVKSIAFVGKVVEDLSQTVDLNDMLYAAGVSYDPTKCCLPDTRISLLQQIRDWVEFYDEDGKERVLLLTGVAGSGKSAVAHSICDHFNELGRLGSSFFFNNNTTDPPAGDRVFSTIARDLADNFPLFRASLAEVVKERTRTRRTKQPHEQFKSFIVEPSKALTNSNALIVGPVLIVIDALDECGAELKEEFMQALAEGLSNSSLPPNFRFLITTRPEEAQDLLKVKDLVHHIDLTPVNRSGSEEVEADMKVFIQNRLTSVAKYLDPHCEDWVEQLAWKSGTLFIWAETACKQIKRPLSRTPAQVLDDIIENGGRGIDDLYLLALRRALGDDTQALKHFKSLICRLLVLKITFSVNELNFMQSFVEPPDSDFPSDVSFLVSHLGSVLEGAANLDEPLQLVHASFRDFLMDKERSGPFSIDGGDDMASAHFSLAKTCAAVLKNTNFQDPGTTLEENRISIGYSLLAARHFELSGRAPNVDILGDMDTEALSRWFDVNIRAPPDISFELDSIVLDGLNSMGVTLFDSTRYLTKLQASPPPGYSWAISQNDQNPLNLRSRSFLITMSEDSDPSEPKWSSSVCCLSPDGCLFWNFSRVAFLTRENTILVWSPSTETYLGKPIELRDDKVVQMTFDYNGDFVALLTASNDLILFEVGSEDLVCRFPLDTFKGLPSFQFVLEGLVAFRFPDAAESPVYNTVSSTLHANITDVDYLTPGEQEYINDLWESVCHWDLM